MTKHCAVHTQFQHTHLATRTVAAQSCFVTVHPSIGQFLSTLLYWSHALLHQHGIATVSSLTTRPCTGLQHHCL
jgi:hypothetical protein